MSGSMITLRNDHLEVVIDAAHGAEVVRVARPDSAPEANALAYYDWDTPTRARDGQRYGSSVQDWLSDYRGGWQECFPNSGVEGTNAGAVTPFHGEASTSSWTVLDSRSDEVTLRVATHVPLVLTRRMRLSPDAPILMVEETVANVGPLDLDYVWAHHPVFPAVAGTQVDLPACRVAVDPGDSDGLHAAGGTWPVIAGRDGDVDLSTLPDGIHHRLTYQYELADGWVAVRPPVGSAHPGVAMAWDLETWPRLWMWLLVGTDEFPWYGRARHVGLEPNRGSSVDGLDGALRRGEHLRLAAGERHEAWLTLRLLDEGGPRVAGLKRDGTIAIE